jgi:hypothetical protein
MPNIRTVSLPNPGLHSMSAMANDRRKKCCRYGSMISDERPSRPHDGGACPPFRATDVTMLFGSCGDMGLALLNNFRQLTCSYLYHLLRGVTRPSFSLTFLHTKEGATTHLFGPLSQFPPYHLVEMHTCASSSRGESLFSMRLTSRPAHRNRASTVRRPEALFHAVHMRSPSAHATFSGARSPLLPHFSCLCTSSSRSCKRVWCEPRGSATFSMNNPQARGSTFP